MAQHAGRVSCPKCGANNFDAVPNCWKCGASLYAGSPAVGPSGPSRETPSGREGAPQPGGPTYAPGGAAVRGGDPATANRAAILLALTLPWIGLPVGWVFMMIEEPRKQAVGRLCATVSFVALLIHLWLFIALGAMATNTLMRSYLKSKVDSATGSGSLGGENTPGVGDLTH